MSVYETAEKLQAIHEAIQAGQFLEAGLLTSEALADAAAQVDADDAYWAAKQDAIEAAMQAEAAEVLPF